MGHDALQTPNNSLRPDPARTPPTEEPAIRPLLLCLCLVGVLVAWDAGGLGAAEPGLIAHYTFDEGMGTVVKDRSGHEHHGTIHGARWTAGARGGALDFAPPNSYVDCGRGLGQKLTGDMTLLAWVKLTPRVYPDGGTNWTIADCEDYTRSGFIFRVDGQTTKLYYRANASGRTPESFSRAEVTHGEYHHLAFVRRGTRIQLFVDGVPDRPFSGDCPAAPSATFKISTPSQPLQGILDDLAIYDRAWSAEEVLSRYKQQAAAYGKDTSWFGRFRIEPFWYFDRRQAVLAVDFLGVLPLAPGCQAAVELGPPAGDPIAAQPASPAADGAMQDFVFDLGNLAPGEYELRAVLRDARGNEITRQAAPFRYPPVPAKVPSPAECIVPPIRPPEKPAPFSAEVRPDGSLVIRAAGEEFLLTSEFSYPHGGFNRLGQGVNEPAQAAENGWKPVVRQLGPVGYRVEAAGRYYRLVRSVEKQPTRVLVRDTLSNTTAEPLGILIRHHVLDVPPQAGCRVGGYPAGAPLLAKDIKTNPTLLAVRGKAGLGLVALDDVFIVQSLASLAAGTATLHTDTFALDAGSSYTLEWAAYPTPGGDYYDFINQVRRDEGRNGTVDGGLGFITRSPFDRRGVPSRQFVELRNLKYGLIHCLSSVADDPGISIEGIEFLEYPKEREALRQQIAAIHWEFPGMKVLFHIAHSLYATNRPEQTFADSRVIGSDGKHAVYTTNPGNYFSPERLAQGWNWYIYYPTLDNSFGKALLASGDVIRDEIGADGAFMDGFMWAYGGQYTYDRWDGHTAQIDPQTKTITRKMGSVLLLSQDALVAFSRKMRAKGGCIVANNAVITRTIARETYLLHDRECFAGPEVHLASTPLVLSLPSAIQNEADIHRDVLDKLAWGNLYVYYQEGEITHASVPAQMYPITLEEIRAGYVKGQQRLIASRSGVYGWPGSEDLHQVYLFDRRGVPISHGFVTTVDTGGVRTRLELADEQCAVIRRIPLLLRAQGAVNVRVDRYGREGAELVASGAGPARLIVQDGELRVRASAQYRLRAGKQERIVAADAAGSLEVPLELGEQLAVRLEPVAPSEQGEPAAVPEGSRAP